MTNEKTTNEQEEQLKFIDFCIYFNGIITRDDIIKRFGTSETSATNILSKYNQIAPQNLEYNASIKSYEISKSFKPIFDVTMLLKLMPVYTMPPLHEPISNDDVDNIAIISRAIKKVSSLQITYYSTSSGEGVRQIIPVAFANNQLRWHVRAYDRKRKRYSDFVFKRILKAELIKGDTIQRHEHPNNDNQWHLFVDLKIKPHPYNTMFGDEVSNEFSSIRIRSAMAGYFLQFWNIDCSFDASLEGWQYKYVLDNVKEVSKQANLKLAPGYCD